jgi:hypothetical protein
MRQEHMCEGEQWMPPDQGMRQPLLLGMRGMRDGGEQAQGLTKDDVQHSIYDSTITPP